MFVHTLTVLLSLAGAVTPFPTTVKRADVVETQLYAYGTGISGLQIYGGTDGKAYISTTATANLTELTWPVPSVDAAWNVTMADTTSTSGSASFYIIPTTDAYSPTGFKRTNETAPDGAMMKGFFKYGSQIMWVNGDTYESKFWAQTTGIDGLYLLNWNSNNDNRDDSVPVAIKTASTTD